jgi:hypothetical protein
MMVIGCDRFSEQKEAIQKFGEFIGADVIYYEDLGKSEIYSIKKEGKIFQIKANGNPLDGGWLNFEEIE